MLHTTLIKKFYTAFAAHDHVGMAECYHDDIVFQDPAFGRLEGVRAAKMWEMLLSNKDANLKITFSNVKAKGNMGSADWRAEYLYGPKKRKVINKIHADFVFKAGKIVGHTDSFDLWRWSRQALGPVGYIMGWTPYLRSKVQRMANGRLDTYIGK